MIAARHHALLRPAQPCPCRQARSRHQQQLAVTALFNTGGLGLGNKEVYVTGALLGAAAAGPQDKSRQVATVGPCAGARGQIAMRVIQKLLKAGKKVSAGA